MKILQQVGAAAIAYVLLSKLAYGLASKFDYEMLPLRLRDVRFRVRDWKALVVLTVRMNVINKTPFNVTAQRMLLQLSQEGKPVGNVATTNPIELPADVKKVLSVDVEVDSIDFINKVKDIIQGAATWYAPIDIKGFLEFSNGDALPISAKLEFFTVS